MSLTPQERQRIYEEEKARIEAHALIQSEARLKLERKHAQGLSKPFNQFAVCILFVMFLMSAIWAYQAIFPSTLNVSQSQPATSDFLSNSPASSFVPDPAQEEALREQTDALKEATEKLKVLVTKSWTFIRDGDYDYLKGSVKNNSSRTVSYWKVSAAFYDKKGNIIDTSYTNSGETLIPKASKRFEIMHAHVPNTAKANVHVEEVTFAN